MWSLLFNWNTWRQMLLKLNSWVNCGFKIFLMPITRARGGARETLLLFPYNKFLNENSCKLFLLQPILLKQRVRREKKEQITKNVLQSVSGRNWPQAVCVCHYVEYHSMINDRCQSFWITRRIPQGLNALSLSRLGSGLLPKTQDNAVWMRPDLSLLIFMPKVGLWN